VTTSMSSSESARDLSDAELQSALAVMGKEYATRQQEREPFPIFGAGQAAVGLTATDAVIIASAVLDALGVEIFELGMWKTWGVA
jgi:hypothetical protein